MKIVSWNVNGIRSCIRKGFVDFIDYISPDIVCIQETKSDEMSAKLYLSGYESYWNPAIKKGYAGTTIYTKYKALDVIIGINNQFIDEGRVIVLSYPNFYLVNCYLPHSRRDLSRLEYKHEFNSSFIRYIEDLKKEKKVILCGDFNVAHNDIDLANYKSNRGNAGFTESERNDFSNLLSIGLIDTYRFLYPRDEGAYTWWSYMKDVRKRNIGWRIDYILLSNELSSRINDAIIYSDVMGSDHCPVGLDIDLEVV